MVFPRDLFPSCFLTKIVIHFSHLHTQLLHSALNWTLQYHLWKPINKFMIAQDSPSSCQFLYFTYRSPRSGTRFQARSQNCKKATTSFVMAVYTSVRPLAWSNSGRSVRIFMKFDVWIFVEKSVKKIQVSLKSDKNDQFTFLIISRSFLLGMRNFQRKVVEKIKTHILYSNCFLFLSKIMLFMR
jgi:hypothetical protein